MCHFAKAQKFDMFLLFILAFLTHGVFSITPCIDGVQITSQETNNPEDLLGNWTDVYHWDHKVKFDKEFPGNGDSYVFECPQLHIEAITPELVKAKEAECAKYKIPFNWADAKLRVDAPLWEVKGAIVTYGENENWIVVDCTTMLKVVIKKVSDNYIVMVNPDKDGNADLIVRELPTFDELKCVSHNLDVDKGISGFGACYSKYFTK